MILNRAIWLTVFLGICLSTQAQKTYSLDIEFSPKSKFTRKINYRNKHTDSLSIKKDLEKVYDVLKKEGFFFFTLDTIMHQKESFMVKIHLGKQFKWVKLNVDTIDVQLVQAVQLDVSAFESKPFRVDRFVLFNEKIVTYLEDNGYPFASTHLMNIVLSDSTIMADLKIERGSHFVIDSLKVNGKLQLSESYLRNYISLKRNSDYNEFKIKKIDKRLEDLPFVKPLEPTQIVFDEDKATINIFADNKTASRFDGILGFLPDNSNPGKLLVTGDVKLNLVNSFYRGESMFLRWRKLRAETQDLKIDVSYPYIFNTFIGLDLGLYMYKKDTTYLNLNRNIGIRYHFAGNDYLKLYYELQTTDVLSTYKMDDIIKPPPYLDLTTNTYGVKLKMDDLDYSLNPRKGFYSEIDISAGLREIKRNSNINEVVYDSLDLVSNCYSLLSDNKMFIPVWKYSTLLLGNRSGILLNEELFENELFRIGGLNSLRGFDEESIFASSYSVFTIEFRYLFEKMSHLKVFADYAYYEKVLKDSKISDRPFGVGAGISFDTRAGIFSLNYAVGKQFSNPLDLKSSKIHFGFVSVF